MANNNRDNEVSGWVGWVFFAGFLMIVSGIIQMINGLAALLNDQYFLVRSNQLVVFDFTEWGWIHLLLGLVVLMAGMAVLSGKVWGRVVAIILAIFGTVANFTYMSAYPVWSVVAIIMYILIIYALTVHGDDAAA